MVLISNELSITSMTNLALLHVKWVWMWCGGGRGCIFVLIFDCLTLTTASGGVCELQLVPK